MFKIKEFYILSAYGLNDMTGHQNQQYKTCDDTGGPCFNKIPNIFGSVVCRKKNAKRKTEEFDNDKYEDKLRPA